jgi:hypothetical protein
MPTEPTQNTHGGARKGAGGKPGPDGKRVKQSFTLPEIVVEYLQTTDSISRTIETAIRKTPDFKRFLAEKEN